MALTDCLDQGYQTYCPQPLCLACQVTRKHRKLGPLALLGMAVSSKFGSLPLDCTPANSHLTLRCSLLCWALHRLLFLLLPSSSRVLHPYCHLTLHCCHCGSPHAPGWIWPTRSPAILIQLGAAHEFAPVINDNRP